MTKEQWAFVISVLVMLVMCASYFFKKKKIYLAMQGVGITLLMIAYLLQGHYFAMVGLAIGLLRSIVYLLYEWKNKKTPLWWAIAFTVVGVMCYGVINLWILKDTNYFDVIYLLGLAAYAFVFRIRNLVLMRYLVTLPIVLSILYNALAEVGIFVVISYSFELCANVAAIIKHHYFDKNKAKQKVKENEKREESENSSVDSVG